MARPRRALARARARRERLADEDPDAGRPGHRVAEDEEAGGDDHELADALVRRGIACGAGGGEDEEPDGLPDASDDEGVTTAELGYRLACAKAQSYNEQHTFSMMYMPPNVQPKLTAPRMI